jgi:16S rRNA (guanine966-N2)-methyltransferase
MKKKKPGTIRIIGGEWRGTRLPVPDLHGLRPSSDRGRETLFNWLQMHIRGARCVDLFAGSGALGLEAASRGAGAVMLVEKSRQAARILADSVKRLDAEQVEVIESEANAWLARCAPNSMDIVFIDPPFGEGLEVLALDLLIEGHCVNSGGYVYVESAREAVAIVPAPGWEVVKEKMLGEVRMQLLKKV